MRYKEEIIRLETETLELNSQWEELQGDYFTLQGEAVVLQALLDNAISNLTATSSSLIYLEKIFSDLQVLYESLQTMHSELEGEYEDFQSLYSDLENEYNLLELAYEAVKEDYDNLRTWMPPSSGILPYLELKKAPEGYSRNELIGRCGQDYLIPAPINADTWEVNITLISELSWQNIMLTIYTVYEDYPPDWLAQPFAPSARGTGEVSISLTLNTSYAYVLVVRDAYAKPFTGFIEERWNTREPEVTFLDIPGISNGDFTLGNEGWHTQGKTAGYDGAKYFYQHYSGTYTTQEITIEENQGIVFMLKSNGARLEVQIDGNVIYYGDFRDGADWTRIIVPFGNSHLGPRDIYFIVLAGEDDGSYIALDDITMVEFTGP